MPGVVTVTPRKIYLEDLDPTATPTGATATVNVLGVGSVALNKIPITLLTQLVVAADDTAAGSAGVAVGEAYVFQPTMKLRIRASGISPEGPFQVNLTPQVITGEELTFTLPHTINNPEDNTWLYLDGIVLQYGVGYTISGSTLTILNGYQPQVGRPFWIQYFLRD